MGFCGLWSGKTTYRTGQFERTWCPTSRTAFCAKAQRVPEGRCSLSLSYPSSNPVAISLKQAHFFWKLMAQNAPIAPETTCWNFSPKDSSPGPQSSSGNLQGEMFSFIWVYQVPSLNHPWVKIHGIQHILGSNIRQVQKRNLCTSGREKLWEYSCVVVL